MKFTKDDPDRNILILIVLGQESLDRNPWTGRSGTVQPLRNRTRRFRLMITWTLKRNEEFVLFNDAANILHFRLQGFFRYQKNFYQRSFQLFQIESTSLKESLGWSSYDDMKEHEHFLGWFSK